MRPCILPGCKRAVFIEAGAHCRFIDKPSRSAVDITSHDPIGIPLKDNYERDSLPHGERKVIGASGDYSGDAPIREK
jgi:hypothetical protein